MTSRYFRTLKIWSLITRILIGLLYIDIRLICRVANEAMANEPSLLNPY